VSRKIMRIRSGKQPTATAWTPDSVGKILRSAAMLGAVEVSDVRARDDETGNVTKRSARRPLYGDDGQLVLRAEPLVSYADWAAVQAIMEVNSGKDHGRHPSTPLLKLGFSCRSYWIRCADGSGTASCWNDRATPRSAAPARSAPHAQAPSG